MKNAKCLTEEFISQTLIDFIRYTNTNSLSIEYLTPSNPAKTAAAIPMVMYQKDESHQGCRRGAPGLSSPTFRKGARPPLFSHVLLL